LPFNTVTDAGTVTELEPLESLTIIPPNPAALLRVTVPTVVAPPNRVVGFRLSETRDGGVIVRLAVFAIAPLRAVSVTVF